MNLLSDLRHYVVQTKRKRYLNRLVRRGLSLGKNVTIVDTFFFDPSHCFLISIGDNCTICPNVRLIAHDASIKKFLGYSKIGLISIKENCFIGDSTVILPGVTVGPNSIVGAGSVVTKSIAPNSVAAGNPAKTLFSIHDYLERMGSMAKVRGVFDDSYGISVIDMARRQHVLNAVRDSIGFIV